MTRHARFAAGLAFLLALAGCEEGFPPPSPDTPEELDVLTYNVFLRPVLLFDDGQMERAALLGRALAGFDVVLLEEVFDDGARRVLLDRLRPYYPYRTHLLGSTGSGHVSGGVQILSRWPIEDEAQALFGHTCAGNDCLADKGVLYACVEKLGRRYHVFATHLQAGDAERTVRAEQLHLMRRFVDSLAVPADEAVILGGDLNVNRYDSEAFTEMLGLLGAVHPEPEGHPYTVDGTQNPLVHGDDRKALDYVLFSARHLAPRTSENRTRVLTVNGRDLSDHYAVRGRFVFPPGPQDPGSTRIFVSARSLPARADTK